MTCLCLDVTGSNIALYLLQVPCLNHLGFPRALPNAECSGLFMVHESRKFIFK